MLGPCTAGDEEAECDCDTFAPKPSNPQQCRYCLHSERHHVADSDDGSESEEDTVQSILDSSLAAVRGKSHLSSTKVESKSKRNKMTALFKKANLESGMGMRPTKKVPVQVSSSCLSPHAV